MAYSISGKFSDGGSWTASASSNSGNQLVTVVADENVSTSDRTTTLVVSNAYGGRCTVSLLQEKAVYTYDFSLSAVTPVLSAGGGSTVISGRLVTYRNGVQVDSKSVTPVLSGSGTGFTISGTSVSAASRTVVVGAERSITVTGEFSDTFDGQTVSATIEIKQEANAIEHVVINKSAAGSEFESSFPASGDRHFACCRGVYTSEYVSEIQTSSLLEWKVSGDGFSWSASPAYPWAGDVVASSRGTTVGPVRSGSVTVTYDSRLSATIELSQEANVATYAVPVVVLEYSRDIPAGGGSVTPTSASARQAVSYTSGSTDSIYVSDLVYSGTGVTTTTGAVSASSLGTTVKSRSKITTSTLTATANGKSGSTSADVYQEANDVVLYGDLSGGGASASDIPASGGSMTATYTLPNQRWTYTSGSYLDTSVGVSAVQSDAISASSLGTTVKDRTKVGVITVTFVGNGSKTKVISVDVYQQANAVESTTWGSWVISIAANPTTIAYGGGTSTITSSCVRTGTPIYTSGAEGTQVSDSATPALSGSATGFTLSGSTVTASANTSLDSRSITITASYSGATSKSVTITQGATPAYVLVGADQASATAKKYTINMPIGGSKEAIYFKVSDGSQLVTSDSKDFLVGEAEGIEDAYIASNDLFTIKKQS